jgi:hypothetical protein
MASCHQDTDTPLHTARSTGQSTTLPTWFRSRCAWITATFSLGVRVVLRHMRSYQQATCRCRRTRRSGQGSSPLSSMRAMPLAASVCRTLRPRSRGRSHARGRVEVRAENLQGSLPAPGAVTVLEEQSAREPQVRAAGASSTAQRALTPCV